MDPKRKPIAVPLKGSDLSHPRLAPLALAIGEAVEFELAGAPAVRFAASSACAALLADQPNICCCSCFCTG